MKHPHDEVIRAYLDGKTVQYRRDNHSVWQELKISEYEFDGTFPQFFHHWQYRIKPEQKTIFVPITTSGLYCIHQGREREENVRRLVQNNPLLYSGYVEFVEKIKE